MVTKVVSSDRCVGRPQALLLLKAMPEETSLEHRLKHTDIAGYDLSAGEEKVSSAHGVLNEFTHPAPSIRLLNALGRAKSRQGGGGDGLRASLMKE